MRLLFIPLLLAGFIEPEPDPAPAPADSFVPRCVPPNLPARMFRRIGSEVASNTFETRDAREVAHLIRQELR